MKHILNIQALRGLAVLLVILFHLQIIEKKYGGVESVLPDFFSFGIFGVDLFFVISGFVMVTITRGKFQNTKQAIRFLYHRTSRIYPLYWFYSLLVLGVFLFHPSWVNSSQGSEVDILSSFLLIPTETLPLVMVGWTLIHEIYFYLVYFFILWLVPEKHLLKASALWLSIVASVSFFIEPSSPIAKLIFHPLTAEFILGCFLALNFYKSDNKTIDAGLLITVAISIFLLAVYGHSLYQSYTGNIEPSGWWRVLIFGIPALIISFCFVNAEKSGYILNSILIKIGDASYSIYLSHILTLSVLGKIWSVFTLDATLDNYFVVPLIFILSILFGILSYYRIEKPLLSYTRKIF